MKTAKLHCWVRTPADTRDTASSTTMLVVPQSIALKLARDIDAHGSFIALPDGVTMPSLPTGNRLAVGHGVDIEYASGRKRRVRVD